MSNIPESELRTVSHSHPAVTAQSAPRRGSRPGAAPPAPGAMRSELELLSECSAVPGLALWRMLSDFVLWCSARSGERAALFVRPIGTATDQLISIPDMHELSSAFAVVRALWDSPDELSAHEVANACDVVIGWAEPRGHKETAVQYAEVAARAEPDVSARAFVAGRLCRRVGEIHRAIAWYSRSARLARLAGRQKGAQIDFANAHLGYGNAFSDLGRYDVAELHYWKALRAAREAGRRSLMGMAYHNLLVAALNTERWDEAIGYAERAVALYKTGHPRFPLLAQDAALLWSSLGYYSSALPIYERVLPFVEHQRETILVLGNIARAAAAVHDRIRYERAAREVLHLAAVDTEMSAPALYHTAEGARASSRSNPPRTNIPRWLPQSGTQPTE